ncbi:DUF3159 domain-containing protein [Alteromonas gracilis]
MSTPTPADRPRHPGSDGTERTVEEVVRHQLSAALGGVRGMLEAAVPTIVFTVVFLTLRDLPLALGVSLAAAGVLLVVRLVQRSSVQFVVNAFVGIGIGAFFAYRAAAAGGDVDEQALAYFLPSVLYNAGYAVVMIASILLRWPVMGFMVGSVTGEVTQWREDPAMVRLCSRLTWVLVAPCVLRVLVLGPLYLAGSNGAMDPTAAIAALGVGKLAMGWPLQIAALLAIVGMLSRGRTPVAQKN